MYSKLVGKMSVSKVPTKIKRKRVYMLCMNMVEDIYDIRLPYADIQAAKKYFAKQAKHLSK